MHEAKFLNSGDIKIAAFCYATTPKPVTSFFEEAAILYANAGQITLSTKHQKSLPLKPGDCAIISRFTEVQMLKKTLPGSSEIETMFFALPHIFLEKAQQQLKLGVANSPSNASILKIENSLIVSDHFRSIKSYIEDAEDMVPEVVEYKVTSLLQTIAREKHTLADFLQLPSPINKDFSAFMEENFRRRVSIAGLAKEFGSSLSSFNRAFKRSFQSTPQRWIIKRRLNEARVLIEHNGKRPSQVYLEVGFQDLSHFSRAFKNQFGISPTHLIKQN